MVLTRSDLDEIRALFATEMSKSGFHLKIVDAIYGKIEEKFNERMKRMDTQLGQVQLEVKALRDENLQLKKSADSREQYARAQNVRIFGLQRHVDENSVSLKANILDLFKNKLKIDMSENDLRNVHRVGSKISVPDKPPAVLVQFANSDLRSAVFKQRKLLKNTQLSVREDLTQNRLSLLKSAVNKFTSKNAWCLHGNIFVKCGETVHRVHDVDHLDKLKA